jgi:hypothetical protein
VVGVEDMVQRTGDDRTGWVLSGRVIRRSGDAVCGLHRARGDEEHGFLPVWPQNRWLGFPGLDLKTGSSGLVIWDTKSPWWFLGLGHKIKQASVYQLRYKSDGGRRAWDTRQDLAAWFT